MRMWWNISLLVFLFCGFARAEFEDHFKDCHPNVPGFDACIREALNGIRPFFKTGLPKYNVAPFDPFFAKEITTRRGMPNFGFTLTLRNVSESGWSASKVTKFVSDLPRHKVVYTQSFPEKALAGSYEFTANFLGSSMSNKGKFTLVLYDLMQTTTITKQPGRNLQVNVDVQSIRDLKLHITNLLFGRGIMESILDRIINGFWQPGFTMTRRIINDLVSTAFTDIFGKVYRNIPLDQIIKSKSSAS